MRIVITGASGHLGACLVQRLLGRGHRIRSVCFEPAAILDGLAIEEVPGDVRDAESLSRAFAGQDVVLHLAAFISVHRRDEALMRAVNVDGVRNVAETALACGIRRLVHVSSVHAYDTWRLGRPLREEDAPAVNPSLPPSLPPYDRSKAAGEAALRTVVERGLDAVIVNPVGILGPFDHRPSLIGQSLIQMHQGRLPVVPKGGFPWVDVRDVADAVITAIDRGRTGENHLLSAGRLDMAAMLRACGEAGGRRRRPITLPIGLLRAATPLARLSGRIGGVAHGFTDDALYTLATELDVDSSKAQRVLDFKPRPPTESIRDAIHWWRSNGYIS